MQIRIDDVTGPEIRQLLEEHLSSIGAALPAESVHVLDIESLQAPEVTFWTVWNDGELVGCGALMEQGPDQAEIKSMRTATAHLRKGVAKTLLVHILNEAKRRGYSRVSLETGSADAFEPARKLYSAHGFTYCGPFADYIEDPHSVFMTKEI